MTDTRPWVEKYRPTQFDDIVLDPLNRNLLKNIVTQNYFPNLLFYGPSISYKAIVYYITVFFG